MGKMGLQGITQKKRLSQPNKEHQVYPNLLKGVDIIRSNQVFWSDITYIATRKGSSPLLGLAPASSCEAYPAGGIAVLTARRSLGRALYVPHLRFLTF
jgi:hypothetical protein